MASNCSSISTSIPGGSSFARSFCRWSTVDAAPRRVCSSFPTRRGDGAMRDVARQPSEENARRTALHCAYHRQFSNGLRLSTIFAEKQCVKAGGAAPHNNILVIVWKNFRLVEVARTQEIR